MVEVLIRQLKILDGGVQTGGSGSVEIGEIHAEGLVLPVLFVAQRVVFDHLFMVVAEMGVRLSCSAPSFYPKSRLAAPVFALR